MIQKYEKLVSRVFDESAIEMEKSENTNSMKMEKFSIKKIIIVINRGCMYLMMIGQPWVPREQQIPFLVLLYFSELINGEFVNRRKRERE